MRSGFHRILLELKAKTRGADKFLDRTKVHHLSHSNSTKMVSQTIIKSQFYIKPPTTTWLIIDRHQQDFVEVGAQLTLTPQLSWQRAVNSVNNATSIVSLIVYK